MGSQIPARPLEVKVQAGEEHPLALAYPFHVPIPRREFPSLSYPPAQGYGWRPLLVAPAYLESREAAQSWSPSGSSSTRGWLVFYGGGVRDVQVRTDCDARWGRVGRVGGFLVFWGFLRSRKHVIAEITGAEK